jgi:hypothetical protein
VKGASDWNARSASHWTTARFDQLAEQGAFELRKSKDGLELKISMSEMNPPFTSEAMQTYCRWLSDKLRWALEEHNVRSLRQCRADVDFSKNGMNDEVIGRFLQALQRLEVRVTSLRLNGNRIRAEGVQHISDLFNSTSRHLQELHLSYNEIEDETALQLIKFFAQIPRYSEDGDDDYQSPIWLRLDKNWIRDPIRVLQVCDRKFGTWICQAYDRQTCGPGKCVRQWDSDCPRLHLCAFKTQGETRQEDKGSSGISRNHDSSVRLTSSKGVDYRDYGNDGETKHQYHEKGQSWNYHEKGQSWNSNQQSWSGDSWGGGKGSHGGDSWWSNDRRTNQHKPILQKNHNYQHNQVTPKILQRSDRSGY